MTTVPFGPQLIGETEKTLTALLRGFLADTGLTEPQWVALRVAQLTVPGGTEELVRAVTDRAHFPDARELVAGLSKRGLFGDGRLTPEGAATIASVLDASERATGGLWREHPASDLEATTRVLNTVLARARALLT